MACRYCEGLNFCITLASEQPNTLNLAERDNNTIELCEEGFLVGPSSGANVHVACDVASRVKGTVLTILCDSGERYLLG